MMFFCLLNPHLFWQNQRCLACKSNLCCFNSLCLLLNIPELAYFVPLSLAKYLHSFQGSESPEPQWITLRIWKFIISTWWIDQLKKWSLYSSQSVVQSFPYRTNPFLYPLCGSCWLIPFKIPSHGTIPWYSGWWFGTWLKYFPQPDWGWWSNLTKSIIFQRGWNNINKPPSRNCWFSGSMLIYQRVTEID